MPVEEFRSKKSQSVYTVSGKQERTFLTVSGEAAANRKDACKHLLGDDMKKKNEMFERVVAPDGVHDEIEKNDIECMANGWALALIALAVSLFGFGVLALIMGVSK